MSGSITELSEATFAEEVNAATEPVLVDFWAEWCGPCKAIAPVLEELAREQAGRLRVAKVNVDDNQSLALTHSVQSIPTMIVFKDGQEAHRIIGARSKAKLLEDLSSFL
jgi:thioredoxin 1